MAYITRQTAAERLGCSVRSLDRLIARGSLPAYRIGARLIRLRETDIDDYMDRRRVTPEKAKREAERPCRYVPGMKVV